MTLLNSPVGARTPHEKIKSIDDLAALVRTAQNGGERVALCHGVFDLLHMGHVKHLESARREGTMLVVTITADEFVNKGPGRPVFNHHMRAEMLAALEYVDLVGVNFAPDAIGMIEQVRPDVYVKGSEYENFGDDVTGKISAEAAAVHSYGGKIAYTHDVTFSSSNLINKYLNVHDPAIRDYLDGLRENNALGQMLDYLDAIKDYKVLLVGDTIIDEYNYVSPLGKAPKENMIATQFESMERFAGGVIAAANHVSGFCGKVDVITGLGTADSHDALVRGALRPNVSVSPIFLDNRPTVRKARFIESGYMRKLFEVYHMDDRPLMKSERSWLDQLIAERAADYDLVIVTDFGHGLIAGSTVDTLTRTAKFLAVNAQSNSGNHGFNLVTKYPRADYVCIDAPEARLAVGDKHGDIEQIAGEALPDRVKTDKLIITHGRNGCITCDRTGGARDTSRIPAFTKTVVDTVGAGDAFLAVTSPLVAAGLPMPLVGFVGNAVGAIKVGIVGHRSSVEKVPLVKYLTALLK